MANPAKFFEQIGRRTASGLDEMGYATVLFFEAIYWTLTGWRQRQPVRIAATFAAMVEIGVAAVDQGVALIQQRFDRLDHRIDRRASETVAIAGGCDPRLEGCAQLTGIDDRAVGTDH